jgi:hypothetical protein
VKVVSYEDKSTKILVQSQNIPGSLSISFFAWSLDGKTLYFYSQDELGIGSIWSVPAEGGEPELKITNEDPSLGLDFFGFSVDSERFYFSIRQNESNVKIMDLLYVK